MTNQARREVEPQFTPGIPAWFCLRTQPKHEHIAAAHLRRDHATEVFLPRLRFRRATRQGSRWVTEALFPNYLFARFDWHTCLRRVQHARGVQKVVHFGNRWPTISDATIAELRSQLDDQELHHVPDAPEPGDSVRLVGGALHGLVAVVSQYLPARQRVAVLLDFLGRQTSLEVSLDAVVRGVDPRRQL